MHRQEKGGNRNFCLSLNIWQFFNFVEWGTYLFTKKKLNVNLPAYSVMDKWLFSQNSDSQALIQSVKLRLQSRYSINIQLTD